MDHRPDPRAFDSGRSEREYYATLTCGCTPAAPCGVCDYRERRRRQEAASVVHGVQPAYDALQATHTGAFHSTSKQYRPKVLRDPRTPPKAKPKPWPYPEPAPGEPKNTVDTYFQRSKK